MPASWNQRYHNNPDRRAARPRPAAQLPAGRVEALEPRRLMAAGDLDPSFGTGGKLTVDLSPYSDSVADLAVAPDGGILMAGRHGRNFLAKFRPDGTYDPAFGTAGITTVVKDDVFSVYTMTVQPDGRNILAGNDHNGSVPGSRAIIFRFSAAGQPDATWGPGGYRTFGIGTLHADFHAVAVQPDGKVIAVGNDGRVDPIGNGIGDWLVVRFNPDGSLDNTFSGDGWLTISFPGTGNNNEARGVALQPDGKIVVAGSLYQYDNGSYTGIGLARLTAAGAIDTTFNGAGRAVFGYGYNANSAGEEVAARDGKLFLAGRIGGRPAVYGLFGDGAPDPSFGGGDGLYWGDASTALTGLQDMALLPDGHIVLAGAHATNVAVLMLKPDGTPESAFGAGGAAHADFGAGESASVVAVDGDGKVLAAGRKVFGNDNTDIVAARFQGLDRPAFVTGFHVSGGAWDSAFKRHLSDRRLGDPSLGFDITPGPAAVVPRTLPWINMDRVSVTFDRDVAVTRDSLALRGATASPYALAPGEAGFGYNAATRTATWTFAQTLHADRLLLELHSPDLATGRAAVRFDVLPGDTTGDGSVLAADYSEVKKRFFKTTAGPLTGGDADYSPFYDVDASGQILAGDYSEVKKRFFDVLPGPAPAPAGMFADEEVDEASAPRALLA